MKEKTTEELKELIARAEAELLSREKPNTQREVYFYNAVIKAVKSRGGKTFPITVFQKNKSNKTLLKNTHTSYDNFIMNYAEKKLSVVESHAIYEFLVNVCMDVMEERGVDITVVSFLAYTQKYVQDMFNHEFPFWLDSGMFPLFIKLVMEKGEQNQ